MPNENNNNEANSQQPMQGQQQSDPMGGAANMDSPQHGASGPQGGGGGGMSKALVWGIVIVVLVALLGGGAYAYMQTQNGTLFGSSNANGESAGGPVAVVNGEEVSRESFNIVKAQQEAQAQAGGGQAQIADDQIVDALVARTLILQEARTQNISATQQEVDQQVAQLQQQLGGEQQLQAAMEAQGITMEQVRADFEEQVIIQKYLQGAVDTDSIEVTEEEIQSLYDQIASGQDGAPELNEETRTQIEALIVQQKQQQLIDQHIQELRADAEIQVLI